MFHYLLSLIFIVQFALALDQKHIFTSLQLTSQRGDNKPLSPWIAKVGFDFENISQYSNYEAFNLKMPNVYRVKFDGDSDTLSATSGGKTLFTCRQNSGSYYLDFSMLSCNIQDDLIGADFHSISGEIQFTVFFGVGGSASSVEIGHANAFKAGQNTITWNGDLTTTINLAAQEYTDGLYPFSHTTGHDSVEDYFLLPACAEGSQSGSIQLDFGANVQGEGKINCDLTQIYITNDLNDWLFPKSYEKVDFGVTCFSSMILLNYKDLPAGYRIFITTFQYQTTTKLTLTNKVRYNVQCPSASKTTTADYVQNINIATRQATATALPLYITTSGYDGSTTSVSTTIDKTSPTAGTIYVLTPNPKPSTTTTTTSTWSNTYATTTTEPFSSGDLTITVDVDVPGPKPSSSSSSIVKSSSSSSSSSLTSAKPTTTTTTTSTWSNSYTTTTTEPFSSGDLTITVDIDVPGPKPSSSSSSTLSSSSGTTTLAPAESTVTATIECSLCTRSSSVSSSIAVSSSSSSSSVIVPPSSSASSSAIVPSSSSSSVIQPSSSSFITASSSSSAIVVSSSSSIKSSSSSSSTVSVPSSTSSSTISSSSISSTTSYAPVSSLSSSSAFESSSSFPSSVVSSSSSVASSTIASSIVSSSVISSVVSSSVISSIVSSSSSVIIIPSSSSVVVIPSSSSIIIISSSSSEAVLPSSISSEESSIVSIPTTVYSSSFSNVVSSVVVTSEVLIPPSPAIPSSSEVASTVSSFPGSIDAFQPSSSSSIVIPFSSSFSTVLTTTETPVEPSTSTPATISSVEKSISSSVPTATPIEEVSTYVTTSGDKVYTITKTHTNFETQHPSTPEQPATTEAVESSTTPVVIEQQPSTSTPIIPSVAISTSPSVEQFEGAASKLQLSSTVLLFLSVLFL